MNAVLAPGLGQGLKLAIRRLAPELGEVSLYRLHLDKTQRKLASFAQIDELPVIEASDRHLDTVELIGVSFAEPVKGERAF